MTKVQVITKTSSPRFYDDVHYETYGVRLFSEESRNVSQEYQFRNIFIPYNDILEIRTLEERCETKK